MGLDERPVAGGGSRKDTSLLCVATSGMLCGSVALPDPSNVLPLKGAVDLHVSPAIGAALRTMIDMKPQRLIVDLTDVSYIDSSGLAVLIGAMQRLEQDGGLFMLAGASESVRTILESARLDQYFLTFPHVDAALAAP